MRKLLAILLFATFMALDVTSVAQSYAAHSVLKDGTIYKIGVVKDGMYRISYDDMAAAGIDVNVLNPNKISMFGNVNGNLPEANDVASYDDLTEMDIIVDDNGILFYGEGPCNWSPYGHYFKYQTNYYSDTTFYFLKIDNQNDGKRMIPQPQDAGEYQNVVTTFMDKKYHEIDLHNYYHRGRKWYGETVNADNVELTIPFVFKNIVADVQGNLELCFIGASKIEGTKARVKINGVQMVDDIVIPKSGEYSFGAEKTVSGLINIPNDTVEVTLEIVSNTSAPFLGLDFISVNACRSLIYENEQLIFAINRRSIPEIEMVNVDNVGAEAVLLDVTSPLSPKIQDFSLIGNTISFTRELVSTTKFVLFEDSDLMSVNSIKHIDNQDIHSIMNAEMLIITDKLFAEQAEAIKTIHEEDEGLLSEVVFVDEIYNEFASGSPDITGIRNFIRMVYERSSELRYVLLLGRGTNDYKNVEGYGGNFVPPYEALNSVNEIYAYVTDDYYGLMGASEGAQCLGMMDIGVGRMPVLTTYEADVVVDKIRRYMYYAKTNGQWRNEMLLLADDKKAYESGSDEIEAIVDTTKVSVNIDKIYSDAYKRQKLSDGSYCYPEVTASIINKFNEGIMMMTYLGHGGVRGLSASSIFMTKDIESLENYYKLPFVVTGTCEFSAFDDASLVSAGEILYTMENGGAIGMFTTTRPTNAPINKAIVKRLVKNTFSNRNIRHLAMGDIVLRTKQENDSNSSNYLSYEFFGDPALRFTYPEKNIVIETVNGMSSDNTISVAPMDTINVKGWISDGGGAVDETFNGVVYPKMYDNKATYKTLNNQGQTSNVYTFSNYSDVLYEGGFSVVNGRFDCTVIVPSSVNNQNGMAKLSFYATDTINETDANGFFKNIVVDGHSAVSPDFEGPEINLSWNAGHLSAVLHDPQGICHYNSMLGRDIVIHIESANLYKSLIVNDYYEQKVDDYTTGNVEIDLDLLEEGENVITLKAWDTHGNSNIASITVESTGNHQFTKMHNVINYPNPMDESTCFTIDYDKKDARVDVEIHIFDITGRMVNILKYNDLSSSNLKMNWDGRAAGGERLPTGVYIYKVYLKDSDGETHDTSQRLVIL